jgi:hypothetical protein
VRSDADPQSQRRHGFHALVARARNRGIDALEKPLASAGNAIRETTRGPNADRKKSLKQ